MDYKERYNELLAENNRLKEQLESFSSRKKENGEIARDMMFRVFRSSSYLMAVSKLDTGQYVDVNDTFLNTLGYKKEEIIGKTPDDIQIFADFGDSTKYIKLISRLKRIKDYPVTLKTRKGENKPYLFSADTVQLEDEIYLLTIYIEINNSKDKYNN